MEQPDTREAVLGELNMAIVDDSVLKVVEKPPPRREYSAEVDASLGCMPAAEHGLSHYRS